MKTVILMIAAIALAACSANTSGGGGAPSTGSTSSASTSSTGSDAVTEGDGVGCDLYGPTEFEMGMGGESYTLQVPVECSPFYLEKGRPTQPDDINPHPDAYMFQPESIDVCAE